MSNTFNSSINDATYLINIEKSVISSMIFNYDELENIFETVKYFMFYSPLHQEIVKVIENTATFWSELKYCSGPLDL